MQLLSMFIERTNACTTIKKKKKTNPRLVIKEYTNENNLKFIVIILLLKIMFSDAKNFGFEMPHLNVVFIDMEV